LKLIRKPQVVVIEKGDIFASRKIDAFVSGGANTLIGLIDCADSVFLTLKHP